MLQSKKWNFETLSKAWKKHQWYRHIFWKLQGPPRGWLATLSWPASCICVPYDWASLRKPWHVFNNVCNKIQQDSTRCSKYWPSQSLPLPHSWQLRKHIYTIHNRKFDLYLHKEVNCLASMSQHEPSRLSQNSQANSAEVLAGITTLKIWARPHGISMAVQLSGVLCSGRVIGFQWFLVLPQVDTITYTARHVPSPMKHPKSPLRDLKKVENWLAI